MDARTNPYTPNAGAEPEAIVGRDEELNTFEHLLARIEYGRSEQSMIITGLRGVGKTVLLGKFREIALERKWVVIEIEASKHDDTRFRADIAAKMRSALFSLSPSAKWSDKLRHAAAVIKSFTAASSPDGSFSFGLDIEAAEGIADSQLLSSDLTDLFIAIGEAAKDKGRGVVLLIDEIQFLSEAQLESVITALHKIQQRKLPVTLVGAGLPQMAKLAGDAKSYAERLFRFPHIGHLSRSHADQALQAPAAAEGVSYTDEALTEAFEITEGYPFFIQELGYAVWQCAAENPITREDIVNAREAYEAKLDASFFRVRLDRAKKEQRNYLRAMAELGPGPQKASDVAKVMNRKSSSVAPLRSRLVNEGMLYTPEHGYAAFTVPHFDRFMLRAIPNIDFGKDSEPKQKTKKQKK